MHGVSWKKSLEAGGASKLSLGAERKKRFDLRKRAQEAMEELTLILNKLGENADHPEREYALIFEDEERYFDMLQACHRAYEESYKTPLKLFNPRDLSIIQMACLVNDIPTPSKKQLSERHYRNEILKQLKKTKTGDGTSCYEYLRQRILNKRANRLLAARRLRRHKKQT